MPAFKLFMRGIFVSKKAGNRFTRRQAIVSMAAITAGALIKPSSIFSIAPVKNQLRFAIIGDWGNGSPQQFGTAKQIYYSHHRKPIDFVISTGDNIYPFGDGRLLAPFFERPFADL